MVSGQPTKLFEKWHNSRDFREVNIFYTFVIVSDENIGKIHLCWAHTGISGQGKNSGTMEGKIDLFDHMKVLETKDKWYTGMKHWKYLKQRDCIYRMWKASANK